LGNVVTPILAKSGPGTIKSNYEAATKAYKEGNLDAAASHLEEILKQAPGNRQSALLLGLVRFQQGKTEQAQKILKPLEKTGGSLEASKLLAATQIRMGQGQQAQQMLEKLKGADNDPGVLALVGIAAISTGEPDIGRKYIEKALSMKPDNAGLRLRYGNWLLSQNEYGEAAAQARQVIKAQPDNVGAHRLEIDAYWRNKEPQKALQAVNAWRKEQPDSVAAVITRGDLEASQKNLTQAQREYEKAVKMAPNSVAARLALGNLMARQGHKSTAIKHYEKAVALAPNNRDALQALMRISAGDKAQQAKTLAFLRQQADGNPKAAGPRVILLENALLKGDFKQSQSLADQVQHLSKNEEGVEKFMATVYSSAALNAIHQKEMKKADKIVSLADKRFPNNLQIGLMKAHLLFTEGDETNALAVLRKLKLSHSDSARPYVVEAQYRAGKKQYDQAIELYKLAQQKSANPEIAVQLAHVQNQAGRPDKAVATLEAATREYPDAPGVVLQLGLAYQAVKKTDEAQQTYERLLKIAPNQPVALNNLAWIYQQKGDKRAVDVAKRAYELQPHSAAIADTYGWILFNLGQVKNSIPMLERAHKLAPDVKDISLHLAKAYKANGEEAKAKAILEKF